MNISLLTSIKQLNLNYQNLVWSKLIDTKIKNNIAPGEDNINSKLIKIAVENLLKWLLEMV